MHEHTRHFDLIGWKRRFNATLETFFGLRDRRADLQDSLAHIQARFANQEVLLQQLVEATPNLPRNTPAIPSHGPLGPGDLSVEDLDGKSEHPEARKTLKKLAHDPDWVDSPSCTPTIVQATTPTWIDKDMTLMWGVEHLRTFSKSAKMIRKIMQEFEKAQWKSPIAVPKELTKQQAVYTLAHICLGRTDIIAFEYSANKHTKRTPMHWYKVPNS